MILLINYYHKWWYKALSVLLIISLILAISFGAAPHAHAVGVLTITVCAAILAVMAGAGIATVVSGMTSADLQSWLTGKLNDWDAYRNDGNVFTDLIQNNLITTTVKGTLAIGNAAAIGISDFIDWLVDSLGLTDNNVTSVVAAQSSLGNIIGYYGTSFIIYDRATWYAASTSDPVLFCWEGNVNGKTSCAVSTQPFTLHITNSAGYDTYATAANFGTSYYQGIVSGRTDQTATNPQVPYNDFNFISYLTNNSNLIISTTGSLLLDTDVINIPSVADDGQTDIVIGIDGVYPGATTDEAADVIMDGVLDNTLDTTMTVTDEYVDAVEALVINEQPISVNTDHHMIGFTNLPDFVNLNLNSIWHYVSDAVEYASGFISWFVNLLSSVPTLAIPLYMSFTLLIVLSFIRRILL